MKGNDHDGTDTNVRGDVESAPVVELQGPTGCRRARWVRDIEPYLRKRVSFWSGGIVVAHVNARPVPRDEGAGIGFRFTRKHSPPVMYARWDEAARHAGSAMHDHQTYGMKGTDNELSHPDERRKDWRQTTKGDADRLGYPIPLLNAWWRKSDPRRNSGIVSGHPLVVQELVIATEGQEDDNTVRRWKAARRKVNVMKTVPGANVVRRVLTNEGPVVLLIDRSKKRGFSHVTLICPHARSAMDLPGALVGSNGRRVKIIADWHEYDKGCQCGRTLL